MNLEQLRAEIDRSNKEIVFAIAKRFNLQEKLGNLKDRIIYNQKTNPES